MNRTFYGNILDQTHGILVHGVSCQGVMGAGIKFILMEQ